jgi:CRP-like cAMP-binding protein
MIERLLRKLDRYGPPSAEERAALVDIMTPVRRFAAGQEVIPQYSAPKESTVLLSGMMGRLVTLRSGTQQITALQVPGDFVDLHAFLLASLDHSVVAMAPCEATTAPHADLRRLCDRYPRLTRALWRLTIVDASIHRHWITVLGRRDAIARAAHLLCELHARLDDVGLVEDGQFDLPLTQADAGDVLGISTVHVNRVIQELRARNVVTWDRRRIQIKDWDALAAMAEFDATYLQLVQRTET